MSPGAHTGDGATDLILVRKTHHVNYLRYLVRWGVDIIPFVFLFSVLIFASLGEGPKENSKI